VTTTPDTYLEFVISAPHHPVTHIHMTPFPRSADIVHLRPAGRLARPIKEARPSS